MTQGTGVNAFKNIAGDRNEAGASAAIAMAYQWPVRGEVPPSKKVGRLVALLAMLGLVQTAAALDANDVRGGWETTVAGLQHIYEFKIRDKKITGVYCTDCSNATTMAFIEGTLGADDISFVVTHIKNDGSTTYQDHVTGKLESGQLKVMGRSGAPGGGQFEWTMRKDPRGPAPALPPGARPAPPPYQQPGPWEQLTMAKIEGVWLAGSGPNKQYFTIRRVGDRLLGVACGTCDNPYTMGALDGFEIHGDTLKFNICHEDWGRGDLPFLNQVTAHIAKNEMRISTIQDNRKEDELNRPPFEMTLFGPLTFEATATQ